MALRGHVFNKQIFSSDCFALFIDTFLDGHNGVIKGCGLSSTNNTVSLASGYFCIKGRFLEEQGGSTFNIEATTEADKYCQLICELDMTQDNTTSQLNQAKYKVLESTSGYATLTQEDLNNGGTIYQFEIARFKVTQNGIEDFTDKRTFLDFDSIYTAISSAVTQLLNEKDSEIDTWMASEQSDFTEWVNGLQEILDEDTAGHLLNLIQANTEAIQANTTAINNKANTTDVNTALALKANNKKTYTTTLNTSWTGSGPYTKTVTVNGITATDIVNMYPIWSSNASTRATQRENYAKISMLTSTTDSITLTCDEEKPTASLDIRLEVYY